MVFAMHIHVLKSKIHNATITKLNPDYEGSITIGEDLIKLTDIYEYEKVLVANLTNGNRFETYVIKGDNGSIEINGAAAKLCKPDDKLIIMSFSAIEYSLYGLHKPKIIRLDENNNPVI